MKRIKYLIYSLILILLIGCNSVSKAEYSLVIKNVSLIDGTGKPIQKGVSIAIKDGIITNIDSDFTIDAEQIIDGTDKFLMPGLFDCHVHTGNFEKDFENLVHYGVTSIFIPGGSRCTNEYYLEMRLMSQQDSIPAPRVFHTSQHFTMEGRHPAKTYGSFDRADGKNIYYLTDTTQIERIVKEVAAQPILGIKLTIEDGPAPPFVERIPQEFVNKTVKEASKYGLEVFAHVSDNVELEMAVKAGVQNLVHFTGVKIDSLNSSHLEMINSLKEREASWVTTLMIDKSFLYPVHPEWLENKEMLPEYQQMKDELSRERIDDAIMYIKVLQDEYEIENKTLSAFIKPQVEDIHFLFNQGINMVLGSDTGNDFNFHGYSLHEEMQLLELGGMNPMDIIKMGTLNAAKMMESDENLGSIEVGKLADMVLLERNPLESISNSLTINTVIKNGIVQRRIDE